MNNKAIGTAYEHEVVKALASLGWWVHFISPNATGAQPFDVIAVRDGFPVAIDCKTSTKAKFPISRLEDNQRLAFDKWIACGNRYAFILCKYQDSSYVIEYTKLKTFGNVDIKSCMRLEAVFK